MNEKYSKEYRNMSVWKDTQSRKKPSLLPPGSAVSSARKSLLEHTACWEQMAGTEKSPTRPKKQNQGDGDA